ncbi:uncharacterized protein DDB_G0280205-like isoform X2 [Armigeres subalbatus]|uniref:uncharacterized protein DDB_G0280205-like isoform X2 n=1 Tax=Armigeres subalbatus TaxID=124917 RepID=UPI002ED0CD77
MDACKACGRNVGRSDRSVLCSGLCGGVYHPGCVGLNTTNFKAWTANVGLLWFCDNCRVNFNPSIMNRESVIMKTMRDLLLRVDSMDLRIGQFGENLKTLCNLLSISTSIRRDSNISSRPQNFSSVGPAMLDHSEFYNSIDRFNLDLSLRSNVANMTLSGEDVESIADLIDDAAGDVDINANTTPNAPASNNAAATATAATTSATTNATTTATATATTSSTSTAKRPYTSTASANTATRNIASVVTSAGANSTLATTATNRRTVPAASSSGTNSVITENCRLRVVNRNHRRDTRNLTADHLKSFYVTPFDVEQTEDDIVEYLRETINVGESSLKCVKLVPRNKDISELSFISFKVSVSDNLVPFVNDKFYWPESVEVREFEPKNEKQTVPIITT